MSEETVQQDQTDRVSIKSPVEELKNPADFSKWKYVLGMHFGSMKSMDDIFDKEVTITTNEETGKVVVIETDSGHNVHAKKLKGYLRAEKAMKGTVVKSLGRKYAIQLINIERFQDMWEKVEEIVLGEQTTMLVRLTEKLYGLKWRGNLNDLLEYFLGIVQEYKNLRGRLSETELANLLLRVLPQEYSNFLAVLRQEAVKENNGLFKLEEVIQSLRISATEITGSKRRRDPNPRTPKKEGGNKRGYSGTSTKKNRFSHIKCRNCGKYGHFADHC